MAGAPVIAIVRLPEVGSAASVASAVHRGGIRPIEVKVGVGVGSALVDQQTVVAGDWAELERRAKALVSAWHG
jgi:2-keto-3-deoxy-6-phosphogluconate aldolase